MKFAIDIGHNLINDRGASGVKLEDQLNLDVGLTLIDLLEKAGHRTVNCLPKSALSVFDSLNQRVTIANRAKADVFVSIHFNAFNKQAYGSEIYALSRIGKGIASEVLEEICKLGFYNRGVKPGNYYVLKNTRMPAILVEVGFCDNKRDMLLYDGSKIAQAICRGLIGEVPDHNSFKTPGTLVVTLGTYLKPSPEQSRILDPASLVILKKDRYQLLDCFPEEEAHYQVEIEGYPARRFIYAGHCEVIPQDNFRQPMT